MSRRVASLAVVAALVVACGGSSNPTQQERQELADFVRAMDHEPDIFWDRFVGRLARRADLRASPLVIENHGVITIGATLTLDGEPVDLAALRTKLAERQRRLASDLAEGSPASGFDGAAAQQRIWLVVAPDAPWKSVTEGVSAAAATGHVQPLFLFDRAPATPPPPRTAIDDRFSAARKRGDAAGFLPRRVSGCSPGVRNCPKRSASTSRTTTSRVASLGGWRRPSNAAPVRSTCRRCGHCSGCRSAIPSRTA
jgi:hypothetical protein